MSFHCACVAEGELNAFDTSSICVPAVQTPPQPCSAVYFLASRIPACAYHVWSLMQALREVLQLRECKPGNVAMCMAQVRPHTMVGGTYSMSRSCHVHTSCTSSVGPRGRRQRRCQGELC